MEQLFQSTVLKSYLKQQDRDVVSKAYKKYCKYFHNSTIQKNIRASKEEQFQEGFLRELFVNVLGYTLNPSPKYNLTTEFKNEKDSKKADGAILKDGKAIAVIELKGTKTKDLEMVRQQAFDYKANQSDCVYVITSNFEKLRFYINNAVDYEEFELFELNEDKFALLFLCLSSENILNNVPLQIKEASIREEKKLTDHFYKDYSLFKRELYRDLVKRNMKNHVFRAELEGEDSERGTKNIKLSLFKKSQKLIDRFLFIFFAEDRGLLTPNSTMGVLKQWEQLKELDEDVPLYSRFKKYFTYLDQGRKGTDKQAEIFAYNGGLFKPDTVLDSMLISDELLYNHTRALSKYDFDTDVDVNILGHIFENSLNEIESVNAEIEGTDFDKQKTKRKKDGVFYTPKYITKYIVDNTVGKLCEEKKIELGLDSVDFEKSYILKDKRKIERVVEVEINGKIEINIIEEQTSLSVAGEKIVEKIDAYREWLLHITICDPACGSGAFLNQALDFLIKEHTNVDDMKTNIEGKGFKFPGIENVVLENNIFGVDINEESVEIAKLSLWLRTAQPRRKLSNLSDNIKCGNSLIDSKAVAGDKAFKWEDEFVDVFANGGFDVVIGNPPYGATFSEQDKVYIENNFLSYQYKFESYLYFYEKGLEILRSEGLLSFITPELFLRLEKSENIRRTLLEKSEICELKFCGEKVFEDIRVNTVILTLIKRSIKNDNFIIISKSNNSWKYSFNIWKNTELLKIEYEISPIEKRIIEQMEIVSNPLSNYGDAIQGLTPYDSYRGHSKELIKNRNFHHTSKVDETCGKWLDGKHVNRYSTREGCEWLMYGDWLAAKRNPKFFSGPRLLFREVPGQNKRLQATYVSETYYHGHSISPFILNENNQTEVLFLILGITNSKIISWYIKKTSSNFSKSTFPKLNPKDIKSLPIPSFKTDSIMLKSVQGLLEKYNEIQLTKQNFINELELEKIPKKLQSFEQLEFDAFVKEYKKAKKLKFADKLEERNFKNEWKAMFEQDREAVLSLQAEIDKTDKEIDQMVYELYGLSEEEIGIVEGE